VYPASYYREIVGHQVQCTLCPHRCRLQPGQFGKCHTRLNKGGKLYSLSYGVLSAISRDPVEKKPLYHFFPGRPILSLGSFGCNFRCDFCQNCQISQADEHVFGQHPARSPSDMVEKALLNRDNLGLAYTYNEPSVYFEYMRDCAAGIRDKGMLNVMVTNGYICEEPLEEILLLMDAFNIDLKAFRGDFYHERSGARLKPVLQTIDRVARSGSHLELTFLIIPGQNDSEGEWKEMIRWIGDHCGPETVLHVSRYFPRYRLKSTPTPTDTMQRFLDMARDTLHFVYAGNNPDLSSHTWCPDCGTLLIERHAYHTSLKGLSSEGECQVCGKKISGVFKTQQA